MANIIGPDVSFYQDDTQTPQGINFFKMRENASFVIVRSGQNLWKDRDFTINWRESKAAGLPRGSYWFYDSRIDPKQQAELWASLFEGDFGELPLWGDFEDLYNGQFKGWKHWYAFLERLKQLIPAKKEIGVYTGYYYWRENTVNVGIPAASLNYFKQYPLWIANYNVSKPLVPAPWDNWTLWQYTDKGDGAAFGVESLNIDMNYFNGDWEAFKKRFDIGDIIQPPPPTPGKYYRVTTGSLRVRETPDLNGKQIGSVYMSDLVEKLDENADGTWFKIKKVNGDLIGWAFAAYLINAPDYEPTPPPAPSPVSNWYRVTTLSLRVRETPDLNGKQIGSIFSNEVVEKLDENANKTWFKIRRPSDNLIGWVSADYLQNLPNYVPPKEEETPPSTPEPPAPTPVSNWHSVTTPSLRVRETPDLNGNQIGSILLNEVVEKLDENANKTWFKIRRPSDNLIGWASADYLQNLPDYVPPKEEETPPSTPEPPAEENPAVWYRVTASALKIRTGPGLTFDAIGSFLLNELVQKLDATSNGEWIKVRGKDGMQTGWCFGEYLAKIDAPPDSPIFNLPADHYGDKNWYRVASSTLNLRAAPDLTAAVVAKLSLNDIIPSLDESNPKWVKTVRADGATGWASSEYLTQVSAASRPSLVTQKLYNGITYQRKDLSSPRTVIAHAIVIDLKEPKLEFLVTPSTNTSNLLCTRTTSQFLNEFKLNVAVNGGYFSYLMPDSSPLKCAADRDPVRISDYAASRGNVYSPKKTEQPTIYISQKNLVAINKLVGAAFNAISGDRIIVSEGKIVKNLAAQIPQPRTAVGLDKSERFLTLLVVDGRQPGFSEGVTFPELAELLISFGAHSGINMDGGGSSTLVIRGADGKSRVVNCPIDSNEPGKERSVGNHLGLYLKA
ncbi:MAG: SH3 domain-containing protein [Anaerolineales bacterium]|nr:SH3 domain-containing protein [Anaerolineales bacterium]